MKEDPRPRRYAVLIDGNNASPAIAPGLFEEIERLGEVTVRRIYGDAASQNLGGWKEIQARYALGWEQQFAWTSGKNASDIALVIDAMDLLHGGRLDGFCLVSSDSDFTRLAIRLRAQGVDVIGIGEQKTPEAFRHACRRFILAESLLPAASSDPSGTPVAPRPLHPPSKAIPLLRKAHARINTEDGWAHLSLVGHHLAQLDPCFDVRSFGRGTLSDLVRATGAFELSGPEGGTLRIRPRPAPPQAGAAPRAVPDGDPLTG
jgi:hypothetical protein